jgi:hypothetical protein
MRRGRVYDARGVRPHRKRIVSSAPESICRQVVCQPLVSLYPSSLYLPFSWKLERLYGFNIIFYEQKYTISRTSSGTFNEFVVSLLLWHFYPACFASWLVIYPSDAWVSSHHYQTLACEMDPTLPYHPC